LIQDLARSTEKHHMNSKPQLRSIEDQASANRLEESEFYRILTNRNRHFVSEETQNKLKKLKILVAGCGTAGGACIEPLSRLGVTQFRLADNGAYELANLNRQHAFVDSIGINKAEFHYHEVKRINPFSDVAFFSEGISETNLEKLVAWSDIVIDGVDVTNPEAIQMKLRLHEVAHSAKKAVFCMLDLGFCQWGESFDYRDPFVPLLHGRMPRAKNASHPIKVLFEMFPLSSVPAHSLPLVYDVLTDVKVSASQLGCASDLLSAIIAPAILRFVEYGDLVPGWNIDLEYLAHPLGKRWKTFLTSPLLRFKIKRILMKIA
jgi:hypothetical protein